MINLSKEKNYNSFPYQILYQTKQQNLISLLFSIHFFSFPLHSTLLLSSLFLQTKHDLSIGSGSGGVANLLTLK